MFGFETVVLMFLQAFDQGGDQLLAQAFPMRVAWGTAYPRSTQS